MKPFRCLLWLLLLLSVAAPAWAQGEFVMVRDAAGNSLDRLAPRLERGAGAASANSAALNAILSSTTQYHTLVFPAGDWYFGADTTNAGINGTCIQVPAKAGTVLSGQGYARDDTEAPTYSTKCARLIYAGPKISLASLTHSLASATLTITAGYTVKSQDVGATVEITGGTGATAGFYTITSVSAGSPGSWTLDHAPGGSGTDLTGTMTYSLVKDKGYGTLYRGLYFKGEAQLATSEANCHVGVHVDTNTGSINTGKHDFDHCTWSDFNASVLAGRDMRYAYEGAGRDYTGFDDLHADLLTFRSPFFRSVRTGLYTRTGQSVGHKIDGGKFYCQNGGELCYFEHGGETTITGVNLSNIELGGPVTCVRIGDVDTAAGNILVQGCGFDGEADDPRWLVCDVAKVNSVRATFLNCYIDENVASLANPLFVCKGGIDLTLIACNRLKPSTIQATQIDGGGSLQWKPKINVTGCNLEGLASAAAPEEIIDAANTQNGVVVHFWGNSTAKNDTEFVDGKWKKGTGWEGILQDPTP